MKALTVQQPWEWEVANMSAAPAFTGATSDANPHSASDSAIAHRDASAEPGSYIVRGRRGLWTTPDTLDELRAVV